MPDEDIQEENIDEEIGENPDIVDGKFFAVIGYFSFLCFVPLYFKKDSEFAVFHGKQALILFILELAAGVVSVIPLIGPLVSWLSFLVFGFASLVGIYKALTEEKWEMPFVYEISQKIKI